MGSQIYAMVMRTSLAWLAVAALWLCVVESQDGVEPLSLLELQSAPSDAGAAASMSIMQKVMGDVTRQNQEMAVKNEEISTKEAVTAAELETRVANGDSKIQAEAKEQQKSNEPVDDTQLSPVLQAGLKELDSVNKENAKLRERMQNAVAAQDSLEEKSFQDNMAKTTFEIREKYEEKRQANPTQPEFKMIPYFMFTSLAKKVAAPNRDNCEKVCATQRKCKSFTWVSNTRVCWWSVSKLKYHDEYTYASKVTEPEPGDPNKKWNDTPGLEWVTPISKNVYKVSFEQCKDLCWKEGVACAAVSYKQSTRTCIRSSEALPTDTHAQYYEKMDSELDTQEKHQIEQEQNKLTTTFKAKETAMKAEQKEQEERMVRESREKKSAREVYTKQLPLPGDERKMKLKVEKQVADTKIKLETEAIKVEQKKQAERNQQIAKAKAKRLKRLSFIQSRQEKLEKEAKSLHAALVREGTKMTAFEDKAAKSSQTLEEKLSTVSNDHKNAMEALMAFNEVKKKEDPDPAAAAAARIAMQESHTKLSTSIAEAEFAHSKEVKDKKTLKTAAKDEAKASKAYNNAHEKAASQKVKDQKYILQAKQEAQEEAAQQAYDSYEVERRNFKNLKANEAAEKKQQAQDEAEQRVLEHKLKNTKDGEELDSLKAKLKAAKEVNHKAKNSLHELTVGFKDDLSRVTKAKEAYEKNHLSSLNREKKNKESKDEATLLAAEHAVTGASEL